MTDQGIYVEKYEGRTLALNVRLWTDGIAEGGKGYVIPRTAWFNGEVAFRRNPAHGITSTSDPVMFNRPEELLDAIIRTAKAQGVTLLYPGTGDRLT